jgi:hypothetical protein
MEDAREKASARQEYLIQPGQSRRQSFATLVCRYTTAKKGIGVYKSARGYAYLSSSWLILYSCATSTILNENNINNITTNKAGARAYFLFLIKTQFCTTLFSPAAAAALGSLLLYGINITSTQLACSLLLLLLERKRL